MSSLCQLGAFGLFIAAIYLLAGVPAALLASCLVLVVLSLALEGKTVDVRGLLQRGFDALAKALSRKES